MDVNSFFFKITKSPEQFSIKCIRTGFVDVFCFLIFPFIKATLEALNKTAIVSLNVKINPFSFILQHQVVNLFQTNKLTVFIYLFQIFFCENLATIFLKHLAGFFKF